MKDTSPTEKLIEEFDSEFLVKTIGKGFRLRIASAKEIKDFLRIQIPILLQEEREEEITAQNELFRSMYQIAARGGKDTNWPAFTSRIEQELTRQHKIMYPEQKVEPACPDCHLGGDFHEKWCRKYKPVTPKGKNRSDY